MIRLIALSQLLVVLRVATASAQDPRLADRFPPAIAARLQLTIDSAARDNLPADPLVLRALEGQAKGASVQQIVEALSRLRGALHTARAALGNAAPTVDITTAAAALQAGMPADRLVELHRLRGDRSTVAPLNAYLDLVAAGAVPDRAWTSIADLARQHAADADFQRLTPAQVDRAPPAPHPPGPPNQPGST